MAAVVLLVGFLSTSTLAVMSLTAVGQHQRGSALPVACLAGLGFPMTWTAWYLRDEDPYRRGEAPQVRTRGLR